MITTAASNFYQSLYIVTIHDNDIMQKEEIVSIIGSDNETTSSDTDEYSLYSIATTDDPKRNEEFVGLTGTKEIDQPQVQEPWRASFFGRLFLVCGFVFIVAFLLVSSKINFPNTNHSYTCRFCSQSAPVLHHDRSYTITTPTLGRSAVVTPMTITFDYELYDGQMISTDPRFERLPNLEFDYAILEIGSIQNFYGDTDEPVSAYEVYLHHFTIQPIPKMFGAEDLNRRMDFDPVMSFPEGYALHTHVDDYPYFNTNAHLLSNKNLAPINSSLEQAHKECNECYYAPGKGRLCTPEVSGTFVCCGKTAPCIKNGGCTCATTTKKKDRTKTTTKYRIEIDLLISKDIESFDRVDIWTISAPSCLNEPKGGFPRDSACFSKKPKKHAPPFHHVPALSTEQPYYKTSLSVETLVNGNILFAQGHLHSGGVNATFLQNGRIICTNTAEYGTDSDPSTNVGNEQNRLTYLSSCYNQIPTGGIQFEKGDVLTVETYYYGGANHPQYSSNLSSGDHKNVMSMFFAAVFIEQTVKTFALSRNSIAIWNDEKVVEERLSIWSN